MSARTVVVGVAGGSCAGKSTLVAHLAATIGTDCSVVVQQDDYYHGSRDPARTNFDHPDAVDFDLLIEHVRLLKAGHPVERPVYDFKQHRRTDEICVVDPRPIVFVEGLMVLAQPELFACMDTGIFIDCDRDTRLARRLARDQRERGRSRVGVTRQFRTQVEPMHERYVAPSAAHAAVIVDQPTYQAELSGATTRLSDYCLSLIRL